MTEHARRLIYQITPERATKHIGSIAQDGHDSDGTPGYVERNLSFFKESEVHPSQGIDPKTSN
ncbi:MAG: hypothetical protein AAF597_16420, partial [Bacteroidota bacterium]